MGPADPPTERRLPPIDVDTDAALDRTRARGRRRQRRRAAALAGGAVVVLVAAAAAIATARDDREGVVTDGPASVTRPVVPEGDPAVWHIDPDDPPEPDHRSFTALVSRIGCHDGETGEVAMARTDEGTDTIVVTFTVERAGPGDHTCPGNDVVPYEIRLANPIGDKLLRDGACGLDPRMVSSSCVVDDGTPLGRRSDVRWPEDAVLEPRECEAPEGSPTDVAHEPDTRRFADWSTVTDTDLCIVRIDVVSERAGAEHCGRGDTRILIAGDPFGAPQGADAGSKYIRDPDGLFGDPDLVAGFEADADLPEGAEPTGFLLDGDRAIWIDPDDPSAVYVFAEDTTIERWPRGTELICN